MYVNIHTHNPDFDGVSIIQAHLDTIPNSAFSFGIHPWDVHEDFETILQENIQIFKNKNCIAIGECGLDKACEADYELQKKALIAQFEIAKNLQKPMILHCVKSFYDILSIIHKTKIDSSIILHAYNGNQEITGEFLKQNCFFSFGVRELQNKRIPAVISNIPLEKIFIETDSSDYKIQEVYSLFSEIFSIESEELKSQILLNYKKLFKHE